MIYNIIEIEILQLANAISDGIIYYVYSKKRILVKRFHSIIVIVIFFTDECARVSAIRVCRVVFRLRGQLTRRRRPTTTRATSPGPPASQPASQTTRHVHPTTPVTATVFRVTTVTSDVGAASVEREAVPPGVGAVFGRWQTLCVCHFFFSFSLFFLYSEGLLSAHFLYYIIYYCVHKTFNVNYDCISRFSTKSCVSAAFSFHLYVPPFRRSRICVRVCMQGT